MFKKWFGKQEATKPQVPEIMGLRLACAFELDDLKLRLIEPQLLAEKINKTQLIQAVGEVQLDESSYILRFYTDDDAFLQVVLNGGKTENHIEDVKLWHFYETKAIDSDAEWQRMLDSYISQATLVFAGQSYKRVWQATDGRAKPVAMTEKTYADDADASETDQFAMLYERPIENGEYEFLMLVAEEKIVNNQFDRCLVVSSGFNIQPADIEIIG